MFNSVGYSCWLVFKGLIYSCIHCVWHGDLNSFEENPTLSKSGLGSIYFFPGLYLK